MLFHTCIQTRLWSQNLESLLVHYSSYFAPIITVKRSDERQILSIKKTDIRKVVHPEISLYSWVKINLKNPIGTSIEPIQLFIVNFHIYCRKNLSSRFCKKTTLFKK